MTTRLIVIIPEWLDRALRAAARRHKVSLSELVRARLAAVTGREVKVARGRPRRKGGAAR
jgi:hypothetical protein